MWDANGSLSPLKAVFMVCLKGTDDYASIKAVFGPAIDNSNALQPNINWPFNTTITLHQQHPTAAAAATAGVPNARQNNSQIPV